MQGNQIQLLRRAEVERKMQLSRSGLDSLVNKGLFPAPIRIGSRGVRWRLDDIEAWLANRPSARPE